MVTPVGSAKTFFAPQSPAPRESSELVVAVDPPVIGIDVQELLAPYDEKYGPALARAVCENLAVAPEARVSGPLESDLREGLRVAALAMEGVKATDVFLGAPPSAPTPR